jgi:hypothetical protein
MSYNYQALINHTRFPKLNNLLARVNEIDNIADPAERLKRKKSLSNKISDEIEVLKVINAFDKQQLLDKYKKFEIANTEYKKVMLDVYIDPDLM